MKLVITGATAVALFLTPGVAGAEQVDPDDVCINIEGVQYVIPEGFVMRWSQPAQAYICKRGR